MRIVCAGGGPAGLYFAVLAKLADPGNAVTVLERNPPGVTYGWGVVFWDDLLDDLFAYDPVSARRIWDAAYKWDEYEVRATGKAVTHLAGYGFSLGRHRLLEILAERARELGVDGELLTGEPAGAEQRMRSTPDGGRWWSEFEDFLRVYGWRLEETCTIDTPSWVEDPAPALYALLQISSAASI